MTYKQLAMRLIFIGEISAFSWLYYYGIGGMHEIYHLRTENVLLEERISCVTATLAEKEAEVVRWQTDPFYKERLAREELYMAKDDEQIYLVRTP